MRKEHPQKMLQNHMAAYGHNPSGITRLRLKPHLSFPEPLDGTLHRSFGLGLEGENLGLVRIGGRTLQAGVGMREIKGRHEPYSGL